MKIKKVKKRPTFVLVDLIEDKIKTRWLFIFWSLLFYIYLTWTFFIGNKKFDKTPDNIEIALDFPHVIPIGVNVSNYISPQVKVLNKNGQGIDQVKVEIIVFKISSDTKKEK